MSEERRKRPALAILSRFWAKQTRLRLGDRKDPHLLPLLHHGYINTASLSVRTLRPSASQAQDDLKKLVEKLEKRVAQLEVGGVSPAASASSNSVPAKAKDAKAGGDDDDDFDLFGDEDDEESAEAERLKQERVEMYKKKKAGKTAIIAKSSVVIDVKPWDDETNMGELEAEVRKKTMDGLVWGASKLVEVGYGIKKLQIMMTIEDDKVSVEELNEQIVEEIPDLVQSVDIVAFNKI